MGKGDKSKGRLLKHHNLISSCLNICLFEHIWLEFNLIIKTIKILNWWWFYDGDDDDSDDDDDGDDCDDDVDDDDDDDDSIGRLSAIETEPEFKLLLPLAAAIWWLWSQKHHHHHLCRCHHQHHRHEMWWKDNKETLYFVSNDKSALAFWEFNLSINSHSLTIPVPSLIWLSWS